MRFSSLRDMPMDVFFVGLSSMMGLNPRVLDVQLSFRVIFVLLPEVQALCNRGTFAMLPVTCLLSLAFILLT